MYLSNVSRTGILSENKNRLSRAASKSIDKILTLVTAAVVEGLSDRGSEKDAEEVAAPAAEVEAAVEVEAAPAAEAPATEE